MRCIEPSTTAVAQVNNSGLAKNELLQALKEQTGTSPGLLLAATRRLSGGLSVFIFPVLEEANYRGNDPENFDDEARQIEVNTETEQQKQSAYKVHQVIYQTFW